MKLIWRVWNNSKIRATAVTAYQDLNLSKSNQYFCNPGSYWKVCGMGTWARDGGIIADAPFSQPWKLSRRKPEGNVNYFEHFEDELLRFPCLPDATGSYLESEPRGKTEGNVKLFLNVFEVLRISLLSLHVVRIPSASLNVSEALGRGVALGP